MVVQIIFVLMGCIGMCFCGGIVGASLEYRNKEEAKSSREQALEDENKRLKDYIQFLQVELIAERRNNINVTITAKTEDDIYED